MCRDFSQVRDHVVALLNRRLDPRLTYHDVRHTLDVLEATERYARLEDVGDEDTRLLRTAALCHDISYIEHFFDNEPSSVALCERLLPTFGYTPERIRRIGELILATRVPQQPRTHLEQILCDADLDYLGRDDFDDLSDRLRTEQSHLGRAMNDKQWLRFMLAFLEQHEYFTASARELRGPGQRAHMTRLRRRLKSSVPPPDMAEILAHTSQQGEPRS